MRTIKQTFALLALVICVSSCASILGINKSVIMSVQKGMTQQEVSSILGKPDYRRFDRELEEWEYLKNIADNPGWTTIVVSFIDGRVVSMDSFQQSVAPPPVAVYPSIEVGGEITSRPNVHVGRVMNEQDFQAFYNKVKSKTFKDDQLELLQNGLGNKRLSCKQCIRMMSIYTFDDDKLEVLKIVAPNIVDRENYDEIINALDFISSEEKARRILGIKK